MPALSNYAESGILNMLFRSNSNSFAAPSRLAIGLCSSVPTETSTGANCSELPFANGYGRKDLGAPSNATWTEVIQDPSSSGYIENVSALQFGPATADWGFVSGVVICDSFGVGSGNVLMYGALPTPRDIKSGDIFQFSAGNIDIFFS